jgi:hypothetical protein
VIGHAEVRVVVDGGRCCEEDEGGIGACGGVGAGEEFAADAESLVGFVDGEIGKVAGVAVVGERAGDADELAAEACGDEEIGVAEHAFDSVRVGDGAALGETGAEEHVGEFRRGEVWFVEEDDVGHGGGLPGVGWVGNRTMGGVGDPRCRAGEETLTAYIIAG